MGFMQGGAAKGRCGTKTRDAAASASSPTADQDVSQWGSGVNQWATAFLLRPERLIGWCCCDQL
jgi:hypothetical protein